MVANFVAASWCWPSTCKQGTTQRKRRCRWRALNFSDIPETSEKLLMSLFFLMDSHHVFKSARPSFSTTSCTETHLDRHTSDCNRSFMPFLQTICSLPNRLPDPSSPQPPSSQQLRQHLWRDLIVIAIDRSAWLNYAHQQK